MQNQKMERFLWWGVIGILTAIISYFHFTTPIPKQQFHLVYMQSYFIPILIGAFQFGIRGGLGTAIAVSIIYLPHVMFQHGGIVEGNLLRFVQIILFNVIGYLTGFKAQKEKEEKKRYQDVAMELEKSLIKIQKQSDEISELEEQLRLTDRLAIIGELTASLAHEVRNPLGSIHGAVEILQDELPNKWKNSEFFRIIIQETKRLNAVVENYLSFAKRIKLSRSSYDVVEILQNVIMMLGSGARKKGITFHVNLPDEPVMLKGDPSEIQQVLVNLILNGIQAMPSGGVINISCEIKPLLDSKDSEKISTTVLEVLIKDQGKGITAAEMGKIFDLFYTTKQTGTGLGLAIVKRITEANNWDIKVESHKRTGSIFTLSVPV